MPVRGKRQLLTILVLLALLAPALAVTPAAGERLRIIPVPPNVVAQWTPIPDLPQVYYAPNLPTDVFKHRGRYYFFWAGSWYQSRKLKGPWTSLKNPPAIISRIQASYFKTLPKGGAEAPGEPPEGGLVSPDGKPVVPPTTPPSKPAAPSPKAAPAPQQPVTQQPPESQESAPLAVPKGRMPKAM